MSPRRRLAAWIGAAWLCAIAIPAVLWTILAAGLPEPDARALWKALGERAPALLFVGALLLLAVAALARWLFGRHVTAVRAIAEQTHVIRNANPGFRLAPHGPRELAELAAAINARAAAYQGLRRARDRRAA
ncbi:MAG: hypothetical protein AB1452_12395, partial [Pseudomonadota bacterium]